MRVVAIVNALTGALCVEELVKQGDEVVAVVTDPGDPDPWSDPSWSVKAMADRYYLPVYQPPSREVNRPAFLDALRKLKPDLLVAMHYGVIFKRPLLDLFPQGCVNIHPTRLPRGQGKTPSCWHMLMGDKFNWITLHWIDEGIDTGDIIAQAAVDITAQETGHDSTIKLLHAGYQMFTENLPRLRAGTAARIPQNQIPGVDKLYYRWEPHYARIPWEQPADKVALHIRALCHPKNIHTYSGCAYTYLGGQRLSVWKAEATQKTVPGEKEDPPGKILAVFGEGLLVATGNGTIILTDVDEIGESKEGVERVLQLLRNGLPAIFN